MQLGGGPARVVGTANRVAAEQVDKADPVMPRAPTVREEIEAMTE